MGSEETKKEVMHKFILNSSKGLAEVTKSKTSTVQFIHESVRDFLLTGNGHTWLRTELADNVPGLCHEQLSKCCQDQVKINISYYRPCYPLPVAKSLEAANLRQQVIVWFPLLEYAVHNVLYHADAAGGLGISQDYFLDNLCLWNWIILYNLFERHQIRRHTSLCSLLYILAEQNLPNLVRTELKRVPDMDIRGERHGFPLLAAVACKNENALEALLMPSGSAWSDRDKPLHTFSSLTVNDH